MLTGLRSVRGILLRPRNLPHITARLFFPNLNFRLSASKILEKIKSDTHSTSLPRTLATNLAETLPWSDIESVNLDKNKMTVESIEEISSGIALNTKVKYVSMDGCALTDIGVQALMDALKKNPDLQSLSLDANPNITYDGIGHIADYIREDINLQAPNLEFLSLINNPQIGDNEARLLAGALKDNKALKRLYLNNCNITDVGAAHILDALKHNKTLTSISLEGNPISPEIRCAIAAQLQNNLVEKSGTKTWSIKKDAVTTVDAKGMRNILRTVNECNITSLEFDLSVKINTDAIGVLAEFLKTNTTLNSINLAYQGFDKAEVSLIAGAIKDNRTLKALYISGNQVGNSIKDLTDAISQHPSIVAIALVNCNIDDEGAKTLAQALKDNKTIRHIDIAYNQKIGEAGWTSLKELVTQNEHLAIRSFSFELGDEPSKVQWGINKLSQANYARNKKMDDELSKTLGMVGITAAFSAFSLVASAYLPSYSGLIAATIFSGALLTYYFSGSEKDTGELAKQ